MQFTLYYADCRGNEYNCKYPHKIVVTDEGTLASAVKFDYVGAEYLHSYRDSLNFEKSDCIIMDIDNSHSDNPDDWVTPEDLQKDFPDVCFAIHYSRHHMQEKYGRAPRPKFHAIYPCTMITSAKRYTAIKTKLSHIVPYFDPKALDSGRFLFGTEKPQVEFFEGSRTITEFLDEYDAAHPEAETQEQRPAVPAVTPVPVTAVPADNNDLPVHQQDVIPQGERNDTMLRYAEKVLKHYGATDDAYRAFLTEARKCEPPLDEDELQTIWENAKKFYREEILTQSNYIPPALFNDEQFLFEPKDYTDVGQAEVFATEYKHKVRYSTDKKFLVYTGALWENDDLAAQGYVQELTNRQLKSAQSDVSNASEDMRNNGVSQKVAEMIKKTPSKEDDLLTTEQQHLAFRRYMHALKFEEFVKKSRSEKNLNAALNCSKPKLKISPTDFDVNPYHLNTPEGTVDLQTGQMHPHNPQDFITKITEVSPSDKGKDIWLDAVGEFFCHDPELINYAQMIAGFAAIGTSSIEKMIIAYGVGANGKSTFFSALQKVLGSYAETIASDIFAENCRRNVMPEFAEARGKRLLIAPELDRNSTLSSSIVKRLCSSDRVRGEGKFERPMSYTPSHTVVLMTNFLPRIDFFDFGTTRRIVLLPFNAAFTGSNAKTGYADFLVENAGESILRWIIEGARKVLEDDFRAFKGDASNPFSVAPNAIQELVQKYQSDQSDHVVNDNGFDGFIKECCELSEEYEIGSGKIYEAYESYCQDNGLLKMRQSEFNESLGEISTRKTRQGRNFYVGIRPRVSDQ